MYSLSALRAAWMVLNNLLGELERKGVFLPDLITVDLRNAKMVIEYLESFSRELGIMDSQDSDLQMEVSAKLVGIKDALIERAGELGNQYKIDWEVKFQDAIDGRVKGHESDERTPISDIPRDKDTGFFRIRLPDEIPVEVISEMAEDCRVNISLDGERHLQVSGSRECVRKAMTRLGELFYGESRLK